MGLKLLHSADWHLGTPFTGLNEEQRIRLKKIQLEIPEKIAGLCRREQCDLVLLAGDLLDGEPSQESIENMKRAFAQCAVPVLIAPGNHDFCISGSPWIEEQWPENVTIFKGSMESVSFEKLDCRVYGAAFRSMDSPALLENFHANGPERYQIGLLHGDPTQKNSHYNPVTAGQVRASGLTYLALGHIHTAGAFLAGGTYCAWPGCPMGRGWDETGDKGVCLVTLDEQVNIQAVRLDTPRFLELNVDIEKGASEALAAALSAPSEDFYRVNLVGCGAPDLAVLKAEFAAWPNLELRDRTLPPLDIWGKENEDTLEGIFFHMLRMDMKEHPEKAAQIRLAAELSKKLLTGREVQL